MRLSSKVLMVNNVHMYQIFIASTSNLSILINFCGNDLLIIEIIFIKFYKKNLSFYTEIRPY